MSRWNVCSSRASILIVVSALGVGCARGDDDGWSSGSSYQEIQGGVPETGYPSVGQVIWDGDFCTGALIAPDVVLTARHCQGLSFTSNGVTREIRARVDYPRQGRNLDLALLRVDPMDFQPLRVSNDPPPEVNSICTGIGYGWHTVDGTRTFGSKRSGTEIVDYQNGDLIVVKAGTGLDGGLADHGDSGGPLLCNGRVVAVVHGHSDGTNGTPHVKTDYAVADAGWIASTIASWKAAAFPQTCQQASDAYGIVANVTWGFAPDEIRSWWTASNCDTRPSSPDTCQIASDTYGIGDLTWGFAPEAVRTWWNATPRCTTNPLRTIDVCQRASDQFGIVAHVTWGSAPPEVQSFWTSRGCDTVPTPDNSCQKVSDLFGVSAFVDFGSAPDEVSSYWIANGCDTKPRTPDTCQTASDTYAITAGVTWGFAPANVQSWWVGAGCNTRPSSNNACQSASELYGISAGATWGFAPADVQTWWKQNGCATRPSSAGACQRASDTYGIAAYVTWGFAPADVQTWWTDSHCDTSPR